MTQKAKKRISKKAIKKFMDLYQYVLTLEDYIPPPGALTINEMKEMYDGLLEAQADLKKQKAEIKKIEKLAAASELEYYQLLMAVRIPITPKLVAQMTPKENK